MHHAREVHEDKTSLACWLLHSIDPTLISENAILVFGLSFYLFKLFILSKFHLQSIIKYGCNWKPFIGIYWIKWMEINGKKMNGIDHGMEKNKLLIDLKIKLSIPHIPLIPLHFRCWMILQRNWFLPIYSGKVCWMFYECIFIITGVFFMGSHGITHSIHIYPIFWPSSCSL